jgi:HSP20 family protein
MNFIKKEKKNNGSALAESNRGLSLFRREMEHAFERTRQAFERDPWHALDEFGLNSWPAIDVSEDDKNYSIRVDVPGLESKDLDIEVSGNQLTIQGSREEKHDERRDGEHRHERFSGSFSRTVTLPASVDPDKVKAAYEKGVLTITASKAPGQVSKKVPVSA